MVRRLLWDVLDGKELQDVNTRCLILGTSLYQEMQYAFAARPKGENMYGGRLSKGLEKRGQAQNRVLGLGTETGLTQSA